MGHYSGICIRARTVAPDYIIVDIIYIYILLSRHTSSNYCLPHHLWNQASECSCKLCAQVSWNPSHPKEKCPFTFCHLKQQCQPDGLQPDAVACARTLPSFSALTEVLCLSCFGPFCRGKAYHCAREIRIANVDKLLSPTLKAQVASQFLQEKVKASSSGMVSLSNAHGHPTEVITPGAKQQLYKIPSMKLPHPVFEKLQASETLNGRALQRTA